MNPAQNWKNHTMWTGDNLHIMRGMNSESVDLIYLDPPFNSKKTYSAPIGSQAAGASFKDFWTFDDVDRLWVERQRDSDKALYHVIEAARLTHGNGMAAYLCVMAQRLREMHRLLKPTGSLYLHCDPTASHYLKMLLDSVFGPENARNEIVWCYRGGGVPKKDFARKHDIILRYSLGPPTFNVDAVRIPFSEDSTDRLKYTARSFRKGATYDTYRPNPKGKHPEDWWVMQPIMPSSKERVGYPTQKPLALLERILQASSNEGDMVLDPFCGCATACVSAERLGRQWIGIDISQKAVELVESRLQAAIDELKLYHPGAVVHRTDQPHRTDLGKLPHYTTHKDALYGLQSGFCGGCGEHFLKRNLTVDHIVPRTAGGTDHPDNLWLLCAACNSSKGTRSQVEFLRDRISKRWEVPAWLLSTRGGDRLFEARG